MTDTDKWTVTERDPNHITLQSPDGYESLWQKRDGCTEYHQRVANPNEPETFIHVCDLDAFIETLCMLRDQLNHEWAEHILQEQR